MTSKARKWWYGLVGGFIGGAAGALDSSFALMILVPEQFNLGPKLMQTLKTALVIGLLTGAKCAFAYLKQVPVPPDDDTNFIVKTTDTVTTVIKNDIANEPPKTDK